MLELVAESELPTASILIRDYSLAAIGFTHLATSVGKKPGHLMRILSDKGIPTMKNAATRLVALQHHERSELHTEAIRQAQSERERPRTFPALFHQDVRPTQPRQHRGIVYLL